MCDFGEVIDHDYSILYVSPSLSILSLLLQFLCMWTNLRSLGCSVCLETLQTAIGLNLLA
ncbi:hypothetical protein RHMOL_Rhmol11G0024300 [Rhododendron molle]|uniref:Uncharacterized protein n=1 Tax=Rhododendron molle TaxID=49168 RepID=A0ACC0LPE8_RHOML|nr:hypothetical protein RHMOL_Rhmol11G0024300 [Rhododendron molle]